MLFEDFESEINTRKNNLNIFTRTINLLNFKVQKLNKINAVIMRKSTNPNCLYLDYDAFSSYSLSSDTYFGFSSLGCLTF